MLFQGSLQGHPLGTARQVAQDGLVLNLEVLDLQLGLGDHGRDGAGAKPKLWERQTMTNFVSGLGFSFWDMCTVHDIDLCQDKCVPCYKLTWSCFNVVTLLLWAFGFSFLEIPHKINMWMAWTYHQYCNDSQAFILAFSNYLIFIISARYRWQLILLPSYA